MSEEGAAPRPFCQWLGQQLDGDLYAVLSLGAAAWVHSNVGNLRSFRKISIGSPEPYTR